MVSVQTFSEVGGHPHNEDAFVVQRHPLDPKVIVCFVADGQGGRAGGGPAAQLACRTGMELAAKLPPGQLREWRAWSGLLRQVDEAVRADAVAGFTTFVGLAVSPDRVTGVSHGDSAAVLLTGLEQTKLTFGQHKNPPVGSGVASPVPFEAKLAPPWRLVVMTDGVWKYVGWQKVIDAARRQPDGAAVIAELQQAARLPGSGQFPDDFTVVLAASATPDPEPLTEVQRS